MTVSALRRDLAGSGALAVLALVVCASALVALGASGMGLFQPALELSEGWRRATRLLGAAFVLAGSVALYRQRRRFHAPDGRGADRTGAALLGAATIMAVLAVLSSFAPGARSSGAAEDARAEAEGGTLVRPAERPSSAGDRSEPAPPAVSFGMGLGREGVDRTVPAPPVEETGAPRAGTILERVGPAVRALLLLVLAALIVWLLLSRGRRRSTANQERDASLSESDAEAGREASLAELTFEGRDARGQIAVAYQRLLAALGEAGAPRRPHEAPYEYVARVLAPLGVASMPVQRLTELYVVAQFSEHPVTERHRTAAIDALEAALESLAGRGIAMVAP